MMGSCHMTQESCVMVNLAFSVVMDSMSWKKEADGSQDQSQSSLILLMNKDVRYTKWTLTFLLPWLHTCS